MNKNRVLQLVKILLGPLCFLLVYLLNIEALGYEGKIVIALYAWIIVWWITQPLPWSATSLLPLVILPLFNVLSLNKVTSLYGQRIFFFLIGVSCFARAITKHNIGKRLAYLFLSSKKQKQSLYMILIKFLVIVAIMSAFIDDAAAIAVCIPIGLSISNAINLSSRFDKKRFDACMVLGILYAAEAGGIMTMAGIPHIPTAVAALEEIAGLKLNFLDWCKIGVPVGIISFIGYLLVLFFFGKFKHSYVENLHNVIEREKAKLGPIGLTEKLVGLVFLVMLTLWILPNFVKTGFLNVWYVPTVGALLLFLLPAEKENNILDIHDFAKEMPWNIIFLVTGGTVMASLCTEMGVVSWIQGVIPTGLPMLPLVIVMCLVTVAFSNFVSGTAAVSIMVNIFLPVAIKSGFNPYVIVFVLPACGMAIMFPWAGAATGTTFASGKVEIKDMIKCGFIATVIHLIVAISITILLCYLWY